MKEVIENTNTRSKQKCKQMPRSYMSYAIWIEAKDAFLVCDQDKKTEGRREKGQLNLPPLPRRPDQPSCQLGLDLALWVYQPIELLCMSF